MAHIGIISVPATGHLNPMTTLGYELKQRGHQVTVIGILDSKEKAEAAGLNFQAYAETDFPLGFTAATLVKIGELSGLAATRYTIEWLHQLTFRMMKEGLEAIRHAEVDLLLRNEK
jgi:zeaxanthin glucosyltransferase